MHHAVSAQDIRFQQSFESLQLAPAAFDHAAHVRLAYVYLCQFSTAAAQARMKSSLLAYLAHLGVGRSKFHETLTSAWVLAVRHFMARSPGAASADEFMRANARLLDTAILHRHYSAAVLFSPAARTSFVPPDLAEIPAHA